MPLCGRAHTRARPLIPLCMVGRLELNQQSLGGSETIFLTISVFLPATMVLIGLNLSCLIKYYTHNWKTRMVSSNYLHMRGWGTEGQQCISFQYVPSLNKALRDWATLDEEGALAGASFSGTGSAIRPSDLKELGLTEIKVPICCTS